MSTPLTDRINALTASANATTGASDTTLTDAVGRLIDGYQILEVTAKVELENDAFQIIVPFFGAGAYYVVPYPFVTQTDVIASGYNYVFAAGGFLYAETSDTLVTFPSSVYNNSGQLGYWGGKVTFEDNTKQNIIFKGNTTNNVRMLGNREYYVLRPKQ